MKILLLSILFTPIVAWSGDGGSVRIYNELEIFEKLTPPDIAMAGDGSVYVLDKKSRKVLHFNASGKRMDDFSRKGQGPGEMEWPDGIFFHEGNVLVHESNRVGLFSKEGIFLKEYSNSHLALGLLVPVKNGWLSSTRRVTIEWEKPGHLMLLTEECMEDKLILEWERSKKVNQPVARKEGNTITMAFNPAMEKDFLVANGEKAWFRSTGSRDIYLIDITAKKAKKFATLPEGSPFNTLWADEKLDGLIKKRRPSPMKFVTEKNYPKRFPACRNITLGYDGLLHVEMWSKFPEKESPQLAFNMAGEQVKSTITTSHLYQILAYTPTMACVGLWDEEEEVASLAVVPIKDVLRFIEEHPMKKTFSMFD